MKRKSKSLISIILSIMMVLSMITIAAVPVNAATGAVNGVIKAGDTFYYDFSAAKPTWVNYCGDNWTWVDTGDIPSDYIFKIDLTADMNFNSPGNSCLFKCTTGGWADVAPTVPPTGANMVVVGADGKSFTWGTYGGSVTPTDPTDPTTPVDPTAKWALNGNFSAWDTDFDSALLVENYESSFTDGEVFSVTTTIEEATYFRLITSGDSNQYKPLGSSDGVDWDLIANNNNSQANAKATATGTEGAFLLPTAGTYTIYVDQSETTPTVWCTTSAVSDGAYTITGKIDNGTISCTAEGKTAGTADGSDKVTVKVNPSAAYVCTGITVTGDSTGNSILPVNKVSDTEYYFNMPSENVTVSAAISLSKAKYISSLSDGAGLWLDVAPTKTDTVSTLIKWNNYYGNSHTTSNPYTFYVPATVDLTNATIYNGYSNAVTVNGVSINAGESGSVNLTKDSNNTVSGTSDTTTFKVMQGSTDAMFLYTTDKNGTEYDLPTKINDERINPVTVNNDGKTYNKDAIKASGGDCTTLYNGEFSNALALDSVKGRGNSSWGASTLLFGKYAYNMKLSKKTNLFGMDASESSGAKSWCLLANNVDESMLRNALTYQLADEIGLYYSPEFRFVDIYDNGEYMGSYLVTEKVDVGDNKLVKGESFEDINEEPLPAGAELNEDALVKGTYTYNGGNYNLQYADIYSGIDGVTEPDPSQRGTYLLEFEIEERYTNEASWFVSPKGQYVVVKTPEFATYNEVAYIAQKFAEMEAKVYADNADLTSLSSVIDVDSFARMYLIQELSANLDSAATSYYLMFNCADGSDARFVASPVWDYDWAYGQYDTTEYNAKKAVGGANLDSQDVTSWYAKNKQMGSNQQNEYSVQSKLANNTAFQSVIKKVWNGTDTQDGFYKILQNYYGDNSQLDKWKAEIAASVDMNETRWGFIKDDQGTSWSSADNADTFSESVDWLETTWTKTRAEWLNGEIQNFANYTQIETPSLAAYTADGKEITSSTEIIAGDTIVLKAVTTESFVTYKFYDGDTELTPLDTDAANEITISGVTEGEHSYKVVTVYNGADSTPSTSVTVNVVPKPDSQHNVRIWFKSASATAYIPSVSLDNTPSVTMTRIKKGLENSTYIGSTYSGAISFYWYYYDFTVDSTTSHTLTIKTKSTGVSVNYESNLTLSNYYLAVDNLMSGTEIVDLTGKEEYIRNYHNTPTNMATPGLDADGGYYLGFTYVDGVEIAMGTNVTETAAYGAVGASAFSAQFASTPALLSASPAPFNVTSATLAQKVTADLVEVSDLQMALLDVNLDGRVNIKDATMMQKALVL